MSLIIKRSRTGRGLFATRLFKKGEYITEYFGEKLSGEEADQRAGRYVFSLTADKAVDGNVNANVARYINHSCNPNARARGTKRLWVHAERTIKAGEEITLDYGNGYLDVFIPRCKCKHCRKPKRRRR